MKTFLRTFIFEGYIELPHPDDSNRGWYPVDVKFRIGARNRNDLEIQVQELFHPKAKVKRIEGIFEEVDTLPPTGGEK